MPGWRLTRPTITDRSGTRVCRSIGVGLIVLFIGVAHAAPDPRLNNLVSLRADRFPFDPPSSTQDWEQRAERVRLQVQVAAGLWPMPERPEPHATIHRRIERDDHTIEAVSLETLHGLRLTGSLYRPKKLGDGPFPGVLCPHGHWGGGRFHRWDDDEFAEQVAIGAETNRESGRYPLQARCVQLARMGCVVFLYDMLGYGDNRQLDLVSIHAPSESTVIDRPDAWGFYSTQAELRLQGPLGVQAYNSLCALDWLASRDDIDRTRLAVTGGSSGATQTLMLAALDTRIKAAFPVVMVSTAMQGGCGCENACCLRLSTSNVEFAALIAPKPLGMASADDWTRDFATDGYPQLQKLYALLGAPNAVAHANLTRFPHNYNCASRAAMYRWFDRHLCLNTGDQLQERDFTPVAAAEVSIDDLPGDIDRGFEVELMRRIDQMSRSQLKTLLPTDASTLARYQATVGNAIDVMLGLATAADASTTVAERSRETNDSITVRRILLRRSGQQVELPVVVLTPPEATTVTVVTAAEGAHAVLDDDGQPTELSKRLLEVGSAVIGADLFAQGSLAPEARPLRMAPTVPDMRPVPSLTYGYNRTPVAHRACDLLDVLKAIDQLELGPRRVGLVIGPGAAPYGVPALAKIRSAKLADTILVDTQGFRYASLKSWRDPRFLPGAVKYGDIPGMLALAAPTSVVVTGESRNELRVARTAYRSADSLHRLAIFSAGTPRQDAVERFIATLDSSFSPETAAAQQAESL